MTNSPAGMAASVMPPTVCHKSVNAVGCLTGKGLSCRAPHFQKAVPLTVRFSDFAGIPTIADTDALANPRGLALKFHLPDGTETDLVTHSFNGFPTATADEFRQLTLALATSGPDAAKPTPAERYLAAHPIAKAFLESQQPPPVSYATLTYFGVNSFKFTNAEGKASFGRYRIVPQAGNQFLSAEKVANAAPGYLADEIRRRVARGPVRFSVRVQLPEPGDKIDDPRLPGLTRARPSSWVSSKSRRSFQTATQQNGRCSFCPPPCPRASNRPTR